MGRNVERLGLGLWGGMTVEELVETVEMAEELDYESVHVIESYADVYTSRVSNLLFQTPFAYLRSPRGSLPHDG